MVEQSLAWAEVCVLAFLYQPRLQRASPLELPLSAAAAAVALHFRLPLIGRWYPT